MARLRRDVQALIPAEEIARRVGEIGRQVEADYSGKDLVVVGLLKGVYPFFADLTRAIDLDFRLGFMNVSSYGSGQSSSGDIRIVQDIDVPISGKDVLVVDDIVDTGQTLSKVIAHLQGRAPAGVRVCTLLDKPARRVAAVDVAYIGFSIDDKFVIGYGMDADGLYRNLPYIGVYNNP
jgi:hypoxanthine phosphoribosyltransferase